METLKKDIPYIINQTYFDRRDPTLTQDVLPLKDLDWYYQYTVHTGGPVVMKCSQTNTIIDFVYSDEVTPK